MKQARAAFVVIAFALLVGCQQAPPTTAPREKETDVHIRTPGVNVDVKGKGDGDGKDRKVDVDIHRKDR